MENNPPGGGLSFGRKKARILLEKRLDAFQNGYRQNVGIIGPPFIGKSFLVRTFLNDSSHKEIIKVPVFCLEFDSFERFAEKWMSELLFSFHEAFEKPLPANFQSLIRSLRGTIPKTLSRMRLVKKFIFKHRYDQAFQELLSISGVLHQECGRKILIALDHFDRLGELGLSDPFSALGKEIMNQKETMFLVTSSRPVYSTSILREKLALLFGNFEVIELGPFDFDEAREFIDQRLAGRTLEDELKHFLIRFTDGHPCYLDLLVDRLSLITPKIESQSSELIIEAITQELFESYGLVHQHFKSRLYQLGQGRPWPWFADVLLAIALGHRKLSQIIRFLRQTGNEVKRILERLLHAEVIQKHGSLFQIPDPLFRFWLAKVFYQSRFFSERVPIASLEAFRNEVRHTIEQSVQADHRELPKLIEELFLKFRNDVVELNRRMFKCPHFTEVFSRPNNGRAFPVLARSAKARWLCQVLSHPVQEEDIHTFLDDLRRLRGPVQKKVIVGLKGIDLNAKLLAQEAKIQYLDLRDLNFLLDLYDQLKVVF